MHDLAQGLHWIAGPVGRAPGDATIGPPRARRGRRSRAAAPSRRRRRVSPGRSQPRVNDLDVEPGGGSSRPPATRALPPMPVISVKAPPNTSGGRITTSKLGMHPHSSPATSFRSNNPIERTSFPPRRKPPRTGGGPVPESATSARRYAGRDLRCARSPIPAGSRSVGTHALVPPVRSAAPEAAHALGQRRPG